MTTIKEIEKDIEEIEKLCWGVGLNEKEVRDLIKLEAKLQTKREDVEIVKELIKKEEECMKQDNYEEQIEEHTFFIEAYKNVIKLIEGKQEGGE